MAIAFITARLGSKRLKKKNIKFFFGKPVISYPVKACIKSKIFKRIIVSTESRLISSVAKKYKAEVPFLRPKKLATDRTTTLKLMKFLIKKMNFKSSEIIFCIYPVTPLLKPNFLKKAFNQFKKEKCDFLFPVLKTNKMNKNNFSLDKNKNIIKRKNKKNYFMDSGQFYIGYAKSYLKKKSIIFSGSSKGILISRNKGIDVNTLEDWVKLKKIFVN